MNLPTVSVVICNYNYAQFLVECIESVLNQSYAAHQVIVIDDGSTDNSIEIAESFGEQIILVKKKNGGQISGYNEGFSLCTADAIIFLDADDALEPNALIWVAERFTPDVVKVQYKLKVVDQDSNPTGSVLPSSLDSGNLKNELLLKGKLYKSPPGSGNAYRVATLKKLFPLPSDSHDLHGADYFCIYGISLLGEVASISEPLFRYRVHAPAEAARNALSFGNALKSADPITRANKRWQRLKSWVADWSEQQYLIPGQFIDFTQQKVFYAAAILKADRFIERIDIFAEQFDWLMLAINSRDDFNVLKKIAALVWVISLPFCTKSLRIYLSKKMCNP
ncbi:glycosyltransferase family 2 protein [Deefgea tanakiae]|uniref:Glycosyltransferase family 2 protein n=1 Tax=Deefgea tanakiae TaxID=2865840 RepID=A0ABX8ZAP6_9NEIS|nr:glycosyltransferase family A protein [Deefgea tanakiae]QZA78240.1 glycosyltransferase family 2 protein [Deefgea tanakiae]